MVDRKTTEEEGVRQIRKGGGRQGGRNKERRRRRRETGKGWREMDEAEGG